MEGANGAQDSSAGERSPLLGNMPYGRTCKSRHIIIPGTSGYLVHGTAVPIQWETRLYRADWMEPVPAAAAVQHKHKLSSVRGMVTYVTHGYFNCPRRRLIRFFRIPVPYIELLQRAGRRLCHELCMSLCV